MKESRLFLKEASQLRADRLAEIDRRVLLALRDGMSVRQVFEEISGRYAYNLVDSALRRCERRGLVSSRLLDEPPRLRQRTLRKPSRVKVFSKVVALGQTG